MKRIVALLMLAVAPMANAEPMPVATYSVTATGTPRLLVDEGERFDPATNTYSPAIFTARNPAIPGSGAITGAGAATDGGIVMASLGLGDSLIEPVPATPYDRTATVGFAVTDAASGQSATATFEVGASGSGIPPADLNSETYVDLTWRGPRSVLWTLGDKHYAFDFCTTPSESYTALTAKYSITPVADLVATPEPGTLMLATLGLGSLAMRRVKRRV